MASQVAGVSSWKGAVIPLSARLAATASLMANSTEAARNRGGSPHRLGKDIVRIFYLENIFNLAYRFYHIVILQ